MLWKKEKKMLPSAIYFFRFSFDDDNDYANDDNEYLVSFPIQFNVQMCINFVVLPSSILLLLMFNEYKCVNALALRVPCEWKKKLYVMSIERQSILGLGII